MYSQRRPWWSNLHISLITEFGSLDIDVVFRLMV